MTAKYCDKVDEWWVNYDLYYVFVNPTPVFKSRRLTLMFDYSHDGVMSLLGHRHDWESVTVIWQRDPEGDWWHREVSIFNNHSPPETILIEVYERPPYTTCMNGTTGIIGARFEPWTCTRFALFPVSVHHVQIRLTVEMQRYS